LRVTGKKGIEHIDEFGSGNAEVGKKECGNRKKVKGYGVD
jgi:hypothetical protein